MQQQERRAPRRTTLPRIRCFLYFLFFSLSGVFAVLGETRTPPPRSRFVATGSLIFVFSVATDLSTAGRKQSCRHLQLRSSSGGRFFCLGRRNAGKLERKHECRLHRLRRGEARRRRKRAVGLAGKGGQASATFCRSMPRRRTVVACFVRSMMMVSYQGMSRAREATADDVHRESQNRNA